MKLEALSTLVDGLGETFADGATASDFEQITAHPASLHELCHCAQRAAAGTEPDMATLQELVFGLRPHGGCGLVLEED